MYLFFNYKFASLHNKIIRISIDNFFLRDGDLINFQVENIQLSFPTENKFLDIFFDMFYDLDLFYDMFMLICFSFSFILECCAELTCKWSFYWYQSWSKWGVCDVNELELFLCHFQFKHGNLLITQNDTLVSRSFETKC